MAVSSSNDLAFAGNDNEVAAVIANELGHIINGHYSKNKFKPTELTFGSGKSIWWKCFECGYEFIRKYYEIVKNATKNFFKISP